MSLLNKLVSVTHKTAKRVGRGYGSGKGSHTSGRGTKGRRSRAGGTVPLWFEGGQLPLIKRLPMLRGKGRLKRTEPVAEISLLDLQKMQASSVSLDTLKLEKVIHPNFKRAKVIAGGKLSKAITIQGLRVSKSARQAIEKVGGKVE